MKRLLTSAAVAAVMVAGTGSGAYAQGASLFDLSLFGGVGYHYNWLDDLQSAGAPDDNLNPGFAPVLGAAATFWATPAIGVRTNVVFSDIDLPDGATPSVVNGWFYDLDLMLRPFIARSTGPRLLNTFYLFVGGGGFTANPPGDEGCVAPYASTAGACLPIDWEKATVGQGTAGFGWDVISLSDNIGLFTELAGYVYDSPFHTGPAWTGQPENDRDTYGLTGRITAGLKFSFGGAAPVVVPVPVQPTPPPAPMPPPPPPAPPAEQAIRVCVVQGTTLTDVDAVYIPSMGDTMVVVSGTRRPFASVYPATAPAYAASESWFINNETVTLNNAEYVRFGVPRVIPATQLTRSGEFRGVSLFTETGTTGQPQVIYVPLRPGCEFQPFQLREAIRPRG